MTFPSAPVQHEGNSTLGTYGQEDGTPSFPWLPIKGYNISLGGATIRISTPLAPTQLHVVVTKLHVNGTRRLGTSFSTLYHWTGALPRC